MKKILLILLSPIFIACTAQNGATNQEHKVEKKTAEQLKDYSTAYFASGCFWCVEAIYESVKGVVEAESGYAGGETDNPTYRSIGTGKTGHSETVKVYYDPKIVSFETLVKVYYGSQNPFTVNGQHPDYGSQYRSIIFFQNTKEKEIALAAKARLAKENNKDVSTEITELDMFYIAEDYHQDYEKLHPEQPYVKSVSIPRLNRFKKSFPNLLK